jgi:hypothetical protein
MIAPPHSNTKSVNHSYLIEQSNGFWEFLPLAARHKIEIYFHFGRANQRKNSFKEFLILIVPWFMDGTRRRKSILSLGRDQYGRRLRLDPPREA